MVIAAADQELIRAAAIEWVVRRSMDGTAPLTRHQLANDFYFDGTRFPLIDRGRGIRKPAGWDCALSILTPFPKAGVMRYADTTGLDGLQRYKLRDDEKGLPENDSLRFAVRKQAPLMWFVGVASAVFNAIAPV